MSQEIVWKINGWTAVAIHTKKKKIPLNSYLIPFIPTIPVGFKNSKKQNNNIGGKNITKIS